MRRIVVYGVLSLACALFCVATVEECGCYGGDIQSVALDEAAGAYSTSLSFERTPVRMQSLGHSASLYVQTNCLGEEGSLSPLDQLLYRSGNGGEDWICLNTRLEGCDTVYTRFGARSSGVTQVFASPWDDSRAVALSAGPTYWTIVDRGGEEPLMSGEAGPGFQIEFTYISVVFHRFDNQRLLLESLDDSSYVRWFTSKDFGATTYVMGINGYRLFDCQFGSGESIVCDCVSEASFGGDAALSGICLTTDFGQTTTLLGVEDELARHANGAGIWHLEDERSVLYASDAASGAVFFSEWDGETYPPLRRADLGGLERLPGNNAVLSLVDEYSTENNFAFFSSVDSGEEMAPFYAAVLYRVAATSPGTLTVIRNATTAVRFQFWGKSFFTAYGATSAPGLTNQTLLLAEQTSGTSRSMTISRDFGRSWTSATSAAQLFGPGIGLEDTSMDSAPITADLIRSAWSVGGAMYGTLTVSSSPNSDAVSIYVSFDYGLSWEVLNPDQAIAAVGAPSAVSYSGSLALALTLQGLFFTRDNGLSWTAIFEDAGSDFQFLQPLPPTDDGFERFFGLSDPTPLRAVVFSIPAGRTCQGSTSPGSEDGDFEQYNVASGACIGGEQIVAVRKRREAHCSMIGVDFQERATATPCQCTWQDFTCNAPEYVERGLMCVSSSDGSSALEGYLRSPFNVCEGKDDLYIGGDPLGTSWIESASNATAIEDASFSTARDEATPAKWEWEVALVAGGLLACVGVSMCLLSVVMLGWRAKRRRDEAKVYGISSRELQLIDEELSDVEGDDEFNF